MNTDLLCTLLCFDNPSVPPKILTCSFHQSFIISTKFSTSMDRCPQAWSTLSGACAGKIITRCPNHTIFENGELSTCALHYWAFMVHQRIPRSGPCRAWFILKGMILLRFATLQGPHSGLGSHVIQEAWVVLSHDCDCADTTESKSTHKIYAAHTHNILKAAGSRAMSYSLLTWMQSMEWEVNVNFLCLSINCQGIPAV